MARHHEPTYTVQLGPTFTPEVAGELAAWAELTGMTVSVTTRTATERGLALLREEWERTYGRPRVTRVRQLVAEAAERGKRQTARRRRNDAARRVAAVETSLPDTA